MEVRLLDPPVLDRDLLMEGRAETIDDAALHLRFDGVGVNGPAAIDGTDDAVHAYVAARRDGNFRNLRDESPDRCDGGNASIPSGR